MAVLLAFFHSWMLLAQSNALIAVSAADGSLGVPRQGSVVSLYVNGLDGPAALASATAWPLPEELAGVRVTIGNAAARIYAVAPFENRHIINVQVSRNATLGNTTDVVVTRGAARVQATLPVNTTSPGQFFTDGQANGQFRHGDGTLVTPDNPGFSQEVISAFLTGLPLTDPPMPDGQPAPSNPPATVPEVSEAATSLTYTLTINGQSVRPFFVGLHPGTAGVYRIDFAVPATSPGKATAVFVETSCNAFFGSCANGGGMRQSRSSDPAFLYVR